LAYDINVILEKYRFYMLTDLDLLELSKFRRELHQYPELSGYELETSKKF